MITRFEVDFDGGDGVPDPVSVRRQRIFIEDRKGILSTIRSF